MRIQQGPPARPKPGPLAPSRCGSTQNMASNIKVAVRVRPLNDRERGENARVVVEVVDEKMLVFDPKEQSQPFFYQGVQQPSKNYLKRANKELKFVFDNVCGQEASNRDVFETTTKDMLASLMEGYNCSVFVYGATGAGKTFTMIGNIENPGITYLTMEHLFYTINSLEHEREFDIGVSYIEVYNENVYDLLKPSNKPLQLREDNHYGVMVAGLTLNSIKTARELLQMLEDGNRNRTQHPTDANAESSRSHAVFQVYVKMRYRTSSQLRLVKLSMIDLAGSERASATGCVGERFKEGANINKSLLSLGNCINKLADGSAYISYRDSKLTRLLKDSLGGNCKTVMIANISPSSLCYEDSYNTLKYAARANKIQLSVKKNIVEGDVRVSQFVKINEELKKKVKELEAKLSLSSVKVVQEPDKVKDEVKQEWRRQVSACSASHAALEQQLLTLMSRARVLALRRRLRDRAFTQLAELAHRSSTDPIHQICTEELPREERAVENYVKQSAYLDSRVQSAWREWQQSRDKLDAQCSAAVRACPDLADLVHTVNLQAQLRQTTASDHLRYTLLQIQNEDGEKMNDYMSVMPNMLKKLFFTLKGYDKLPAGLSAEYHEVMRKAKSARNITWSDEVAETDPQFKYIATLDLGQPTTIKDCLQNDEDAAVHIIVDEDVTDAEIKEPRLAAKRKGTPIKLLNDDTIIINDSFENMDSKNLNSAKKVKQEPGSVDIENAVLDPKDLNSTFVLAGKVDAIKKTEVKRILTDRTNTMSNRAITFYTDKAKIVKPLVGKALPQRRPATAASAPAFGSSMARDGRPAQRTVQECTRPKANITQRSVGCKAVRARERFQNHPYSRPPIAPPAKR